MADPKSERPEITPEDLEARLLQLMRNSAQQLSAPGPEADPFQQRPDADYLTPEEAARLTEAARAGKMRAPSSSVPPPQGTEHLQPDSARRTSDGMEARLAAVQAHVDHISNDVASLKAELKDVGERMQRLEKNISRLPGKSFAISVALLALVLLAALILFQAKVQALLGAAH